MESKPSSTDVAISLVVTSMHRQAKILAGVLGTSGSDTDGDAPSGVIPSSASRRFAVDLPVAASAAVSPASRPATRLPTGSERPVTAPAAWMPSGRAEGTKAIRDSS